MAFTGSRFPRIRPDELEAVNEVLSSGNGRLMSRLAWGLLNRAPEQFSDEFTDLLLILLGKLPAGGRGMVARQIGGGCATSTGISGGRWSPISRRRTGPRS